ncbi:unnamed protein product [Boreogadus saida]
MTMWSTLALLSLSWFVDKTAVGYTTRLIKGKTNTKYAISCYIFILFSVHLFVSSLKAQWKPLHINQGNSSKDRFLKKSRRCSECFQWNVFGTSVTPEKCS